MTDFPLSVAMLEKGADQTRIKVVWVALAGIPRIEIDLPKPKPYGR